MTTYSKLIISAILLCSGVVHAQELWKKVAVVSNTATSRLAQAAPAATYDLDDAALQLKMQEVALNNSQSTIISLPLPDGTFRDFKVWQSSVLPAELATKYPEITTYTGEAIDNPTVTAKIDYTSFGFHAMILAGTHTSFIDPIDRSRKTNTYAAHYMKDETRSANEKMQCITQSNEPVNIEPLYKQKQANRISSGTVLRTYRLALSCNHQYAIAATGIDTPTKAQTLSKMTTTLNRVNGVYEREFSVTMKFVAKEDTLIFVKDANDPFGPGNNFAGILLDSNQEICDRLIGKANYDIGHIFSTGGGGISVIGCICDSNSKAKSVTGSEVPYGDGFDIDYVAHEMGHEFGSEHTFNDNINKLCNLNAYAPTAYEPGSGSTIMAYAGICSPDNLQPHSDFYFCASSLIQINHYITVAGDACAVKTNTGNKPVSNPLVSAAYSIPYLTPFELTVPKAVDSVGSNTVTYCWEQWNLGDFGQPLSNTFYGGPIFRSYSPDTSTTRIFPRIGLVLKGKLSDVGTENNQGEKAAEVARFLTFKLTMRNLLNGKGCYLFPDDTIHLDAINTGKGFTVTSQNELGMLYLGASPQTVKWDVVNTTAAPISTPEVDIFLSGDGGYTWPWHLGTFSNNGQAQVTLPNPDTTIPRARIKVKGKGNVFFNINGNDFAVIKNVDSTGEISVFPIPSRNTLNIVTGNKGSVAAVAYNAAGEKMWTGDVNGIVSLDVWQWPRGMYIIKLIDYKNDVTIRKIVLY